MLRRLLSLPLAALLLVLTAAPGGIPGGNPAWAQQPVPALTGRVVDLTATLSAGQHSALESRLADLERRKGSQIVVLIVPGVRPESIEQYSLRVAEAWQPGRQGIDDSVLVVLALDDREVRIEVGYGLEGVIPDATANRIIDEFMVPRFRAGDYAGGLEAAIERLIGLVDGEPLPAPASSRPPAGFENVLPLVFILSLIAGGLLTRMLGVVPGAAATGTLAGIVTWLVAGLLGLSLFMAFVGFFVALTGGGSGGRWSSRGRGGHGGGYGGSWGSGGGGFRGGGGSFGGGGASGRW